MVNMCVTRCGHVFHASCAFDSLERRIDCPLCRTQLVNEVFDDDENDFDVAAAATIDAAIDAAAANDAYDDNDEAM